MDTPHKQHDVTTPFFLEGPRSRIKFLTEKTYQFPGGEVEFRLMMEKNQKPGFPMLSYGFLIFSRSVAKMLGCWYISWLKFTQFPINFHRKSTIFATARLPGYSTLLPSEMVQKWSKVVHHHHSPPKILNAPGTTGVHPIPMHPMPRRRAFGGLRRGPVAQT